MKFSALRTPIIEPLTGKTSDGRHYCIETFLIDLAKRLELPGFGDNAIKGRDGRAHPVDRAEDFYLRAFANIVENAKVPEASAEEVTWVEKNYPVAKFRETLAPREWRRLCFALARGGVFRAYDDSFDGDMFKYGLKQAAIYNEQLAASKNSLTGESFPGGPKYFGAVDSAGKSLSEEDKEYPFCLVTHKTNLHTQSRSVWYAYTMELFPENYIRMNRADSDRLGLRDMEEVRLISRSNPEGIKGKVQITQTVRPGCIAVSHHYGHTQFGASPLEVRDGETVFLGGESVVEGGKFKPNPRYSGGLNGNLLTRLDPNLNNTPLVDLVSGTPDFSNTRVRVEKA